MDKKRIKDINNCHKEHEDRINLTVPKGDRERIQSHAAEHQESANQFIRRAIRETMERDQRLDEWKRRIVAETSARDAPTDEIYKDAKILDALATLEPIIPDIVELYISKRAHREEKHEARLIMCDSAKSK